MTANEVRESYKKFFEAKGHKIVASAPMVIKDDPTLMFTNAGMHLVPISHNDGRYDDVL